MNAASDLKERQAGEILYALIVAEKVVLNVETIPLINLLMR